MRRTLRELLTIPADDVREATNGIQAEMTYQEQRPDWVVMDVQMESGGGLAATRHILARDPGAKVIVISQFDDPDLRASAREVGARAFVNKSDLFSLIALIHPSTA
jgi:DNA-binding NarL/FixJ family response regulator